MSGVFGVSAWLWLLLAVLAIAVAAFLFRGRLIRGSEQPRTPATGNGGWRSDQSGRLAVLDSTVVDAGRRLVLVRCDDTEHLVLIGGPVDVVVASNIGGRGRMRDAGRAGGRGLKGANGTRPAQPGQELGDAGRRGAPVPPAQAAESRPAHPAVRQRAPEAPKAEIAATEMAAGRTRAADPPKPPVRAAEPPQPPRGAAEMPNQRSRGPEPARPQARGPESARTQSAPTEPPERAARPALAAVPPAAMPPSAARKAPQQSEQVVPAARPTTTRPQAPVRREPPALPSRAALTDQAFPRPQQDLPATGADMPSAPVTDAKAQRPNGDDPGRRPPLPPADLPWPDPADMEGEIVQALRNELKPGEAGASVRQPPPPPPSALQTDHDDALGELENRLEEALAREVGPGRAERGGVPAPDAFAFDRGPAPRAPEPPAPHPNSPPARATPGMGQNAAAPEPRPAPDRHPPPDANTAEDAPVIPLNTRRRDAFDPLEDEMARLLGELTGDSSRR